MSAISPIRLYFDVDSMQRAVLISLRAGDERAAWPAYRAPADCVARASIRDWVRR